MNASRRALVACGLSASLLMGVALTAQPASAHAIIELNGAEAHAGTASTMTLEVQHGCMPSQPTNKVVVFFKASFRRIVPLTVDGWTATTGTRASGRKFVIWQTATSPQPFADPLYLPMRITWPSRPGEYSLPTRQFCVGGGHWNWNTRWQPASADVPSPPLEPLPSVLVLAR